MALQIYKPMQRVKAHGLEPKCSYFSHDFQVIIQYQRQQCGESTSFFFLKTMKYTLEPESDHLNVVVGCFGNEQIDNEDCKAKSLVGICI
ncbi:hypothetical protein Syun_025749 [Stephania yunnanensis]|uniref:Uncharacterized protein n=1 Tax=Stephania yunnanensis TaxID=152371 RepID=A0AAP0ESQ5_9MAGN